MGGAQVASAKRVQSRFQPGRLSGKGGKKRLAWRRYTGTTRQRQGAGIVYEVPVGTLGTRTDGRRRRIGSRLNLVHARRRGADRHLGFSLCRRWLRQRRRAQSRFARGRDLLFVQRHGKTGLRGLRQSLRAGRQGRARTNAHSCRRHLCRLHLGRPGRHGRSCPRYRHHSLGHDWSRLRDRLPLCAMLPEMTANHSTKVSLEAHAELLERILWCRTDVARRSD